MAVSPRKHYTIRLRSSVLELGPRTLLMGILNATTDSFSDGGRFADFDSALAQARLLIASGADILDIGGESTRPFSDSIPLETELARVVPLVRAIREESSIPISVDTTKSAVAREALDAGADIINDISSLRFDEGMAPLAAETGAPVILMHMLGTPRTMQESPIYASLFSEVISFLEERIQFAVRHGVSRERIIVDPGIGFGKSIDHNLALVKNADTLQALDRPILLGASRKRFIGSLLDRPVEDRETGTAVVNALGIAAGVHILRVHDIGIHRQVALMSDAIRNAF